MEICPKMLTPHATSFKVNGTDTDRSATYDFLFTVPYWAYLVPFSR